MCFVFPGRQLDSLLNLNIVYDQIDKTAFLPYKEGRGWQRDQTSDRILEVIKFNSGFRFELIGL